MDSGTLAFGLGQFDLSTDDQCPPHRCTEEQSGHHACPSRSADVLGGQVDECGERGNRHRGQRTHHSAQPRRPVQNCGVGEIREDQPHRQSGSQGSVDRDDDGPRRQSCCRTHPPERVDRTQQSQHPDPNPGGNVGDTSDIGPHLVQADQVEEYPDREQAEGDERIVPLADTPTSGHHRLIRAHRGA